MEKEAFIEILLIFQHKYPHRHIEMNGTIVNIDGEDKFNTDGYNLLYNLKRLCDCLEDELL